MSIVRLVGKKRYSNVNRRRDSVIFGICSILDGLISIFSFGFLEGNFVSCHIDIKIDKILKNWKLMDEKREKS